MRTSRLGLIFCVLALLQFAAQGRAQVPALNQPGMSAAMIKLFGNHTAFSTKALVRMLDKADQETMSMPMGFALLDRKIRLDLDMTQIKSKDFTPAMLGPLKQMGMEKMATIVRPDTKVTLVVCPAIQAYAEMPMSREEAADWDRVYRVEKTSLGRETLDGHPCEKKKAPVVDEKGAKIEAVVWDATDLKEFPIQMQISQPEATVLMRYREVQFVRPEPKQFEAPAGFTRYDSMEKLMQGAMMKMLGGK